MRVNHISSVYLENRDVDPALWDELPLPQAVEISGELSIDGTRLYLSADSLTDTDGNALVVEAAPADEILPDSDDRLLTERDISGLSVQQSIMRKMRSMRGTDGVSSPPSCKIILTRSRGTAELLTRINSMRAF